MFWTKLAQKNCFPSKIWKVNTTIELFTFELVLVPHFSWNWQLKVFGPNLPKKGVSLLKQWRPQLKQVKTTIETSKDHNWILDIRIIVATKLELKLTILIFFVQLCLKWCFSSKTEKVDTATEFCVFEFVLELVLCHWILRIRINFFWPNCPKRVLAVKNWKIALVHPSMVGTYYIKPFRTGIDRYNVSTPSQREKGTWIKQIYFFKWNF